MVPVVIAAECNVEIVPDVAVRFVVVTTGALTSASASINGAWTFV